MSAFTGTGALIRFILRRDRIRTPIWIIAISFAVIGTALVLPGTYPTQESRQERAALLDNPAIKMMIGPGYGRENYTFGAMMTDEMLGFTAIVVALMSIFMVVRHTRAEEETGRLELVRAAVVGRHAAMTATLIVVTGVNLVLGAIIALGLPASLDELSLRGSVLFGAALAATGIVFAAIAAVSVQINQFARGASGLAGAVLAISYLIRGFGNVQDNFLTWLSPFGWALYAAPYVLDRWWPLALSAATATLLIPLAYVLSERRDVGAGLAPPRPGPAVASTILSKPMGMPLRLQRASLIGWAIGLTLFAAGIGSIATEVTDMFEENPTAQAYLEAMGVDQTDVVDAALAVYISFFAQFAAIYSVGTITRLRAEETSGRAENVLAAAIGRPRWAGEYLGFSVITSTIILTVTGLGAGIMYAASINEPGEILRLTGAALVYAPALWLAAGVALAVFGLFPRAMILAWAVPAYAIFMLSIGPLLGVPSWLYELSPFEHVPRLPAGNFTIVPLLVITALAVALMIAGLAGFRRRDLET